ncbi:prepilin peptidase [Vibrio hangzhouensis]|uniref:A24 family peptidase n=1 Tax=Vibrio hangzhouensis TaxID=462991 RepID=UPI001C972A14|nr:prepilin peptidase [Vibrio hangzhouensis]MBY6196594.1 prepilin peptidase [Vibrio hangzhouensis]
MIVAIWTLLSILVVYDLRENRIPNNVILLLLVIVMSHTAYVSGGLFSIPVSHYTGFLLGFSIGFTLYLLKVLAAGDVKLIAVLSFNVGVESVPEFYLVICLLGGFLSLFYVAREIASSNKDFAALARTYVVSNIYGRIQKGRHIDTIVFRIPFAPAIVLGYLALPYFI